MSRFFIIISNVSMWVVFYCVGVFIPIRMIGFLSYLVPLPDWVEPRTLDSLDYIDERERRVVDFLCDFVYPWRWIKLWRRWKDYKERKEDST